MDSPGMTYIRLALESCVCEVVADILLVVGGGLAAGLPLRGVPES